MTKNQSTVCMQYHLPVELTRDKDIGKGPFFIYSITKYFSKIFRKYETTAAISKDDFIINIKIENIKNYQDCKKVLSEKLDALIEDVTGFEYEITLEQSQRCVYSLDIEDLEPDSKYEGFIQEKVGELNKLKLKNCIKALLAGGGNKTSITKDVKAIIDELSGSSTKKRKKSTFVKPTVEEIQQYITEKGYDFDAEEFYNHYESNGWFVGQVPMQRWKAACATWNKKHGQFSPAKKERYNIDSTYDIKELERKAMFKENYEL
ncbi:MAG: hypothetical protein ACLUFN_07675 [Eubacterium sp.]